MVGLRLLALQADAVCGRAFLTRNLADREAGHSGWAAGRLLIDTLGGKGVETQVDSRPFLFETDVCHVMVS